MPPSCSPPRAETAARLRLAGARHQGGRRIIVHARLLKAPLSPPPPAQASASAAWRWCALLLLIVAFFKEALSKGDFWFKNQSYGELLFQGDPPRAGVRRVWWTEALADINRALEIEPRDEAVLAARAGIHLKTRQLDLALKDYEAAATTNPARPSHQEMVAKIKSALSGAASGSSR